MKTAQILSFVLCCVNSIVFAQKYDVQIINDYFKLVSPYDINDYSRINSARIETICFYQDDVFAQLRDANAYKMNKHIVLRKWPDKQKSIIYRDSIVFATHYCTKNTNEIVYRGGIKQKLPRKILFEFYPVIAKNYIDNGKRIINSGSKQINNTLYQEVKIVNKDTSVIYLYFDQSNLLSIILDENGVYTKLEKYTNINGFLIPFKVTKYKDNNVFFESNYRSVKLNCKISTDEFSDKD